MRLRMARLMVSSAIVALVALLAGAPAAAQVSTGRIGATIADTTGAILSAIADDALRQTLVAVESDGVLRFDVRLQGDDQTAFFVL